MKNILLFSTSLSSGGSERFALTHQKMLIGMGYKVYLVASNPIIELGEVNKDIYYTLHNDKALLNVALKPYRLHKFIKEKKIDLIIDNRTKLNGFKTLIYELAFGNRKKIKIIHNHNTSLYLFDTKWLNNLLLKNYAKIVGVSQAIQEKVEHLTAWNNVEFIYNPIPEINLQQTVNDIPDSPYILFYGRFENKSKNLLFLLEAYHHSELPQKNIKLFLMGKGKDQQEIEKKINELQLNSLVKILPQRSQPFDVVSKALFTVMCSHYEGFPMTMVESLSLGVPVVSTNFQSGPSEIITNEFNGLITNQNLTDYTKALNRMASDHELLEFCKNNAKKSVEHLSMQNISNQWSDLIDKIT